MSATLVINSGSSSIKYQIIDVDSEEVIAKGLIERIGSDMGVVNHTGPDGEKHTYDHPAPDHTAGIQAMLDACATHGPELSAVGIDAVGHRVAHGGSKFIQPTVIDDGVVASIEEIVPLAPLHNPGSILGIRAARDSFPDVPHVAVFDTAFHQTMPAEAYTYAIDRAVADQYQIRRYGFHGTSHNYVSQLAAKHLQLPWDQMNTIVLHVGNGSSACAIRGGKSVETSMGLTPLEGLVMGTRSGDLDAGIVFHLHRQAGMSPDEIDTLLNRKSGLLGLSGSIDMRDVIAGVQNGDANAELALNTYCHRLRKYVGAYYAVLGHVDCIVWTAGVGENNPDVRERTLSHLEDMGIKIDDVKNRSEDRGIRTISADDSRVAVLVIPTNEELEIARQTEAAVL